MTAADKLAILAAVDAYLFATDDPHDLAALAAHFAPGARWQCYAAGEAEPYLSFGSLEEVEAAMGRAASTAPALRHHRTGIRFEPVGADLVRTTVKVLVTEQDAADAPPRIANVALEHGTWRKAPTGWEIVSWTIRRDGGRPSP